MKVLVIPGLRIEVDAYEASAKKKARSVLRSINQAIAGLGGDPVVFQYVPRGSADHDEPYYEERPDDDPSIKKREE